MLTQLEHDLAAGEAALVTAEAAEAEEQAIYNRIVEEIEGEEQAAAAGWAERRDVARQRLATVKFQAHTVRDAVKRLRGEVQRLRINAHLGVS